MKQKFFRFFLAISLLVLFPFCKKTQKRLPLVTTSSVYAEVKVAHCSGVLYSDGDAKVTEKGICWGIQEDISTADNKVICQTDQQTFTTDITGLDPSTKYYARAYAINEFGISYGKVVSFTTLSVDFPSLSLSAYYPGVVNSEQFSLQLNQSLPFSFTTGICWSKNSLPTLLDSTVLVSTRSYNDVVPFFQSYNPVIGNLDESTTYYARAFCSSPYGILYSNQVTWITPTPDNPVSFLAYDLGFTDITCNVTVSGIDASQVKTTGVCWSENPVPTVTDSKMEQASIAPNPFYITTLQLNTTYYLRAYIITNTKTIYGPEQKMIRTLKGTVTDINGNVYNTVEIYGQEWMASNLRVSSFNNGTAIPKIANYNQWVNNVNAQIPVYCYYADNASYDATLGKLYPRYVAQNPNLAPVGWRVATVDDWQNLLGNATAPDLCSANGAWGQYDDITNPYGFSLLPAGFWDSGYGSMGQKSRFWALPTSSSNNAVEFTSYTTANITWFPNGNGQSIRCIKE